MVLELLYFLKFQYHVEFFVILRLFLIEKMATLTLNARMPLKLINKLRSEMARLALLLVELG